MPAFEAANTVANMIVAQRIAAKTKPVVFMRVPPGRNTQRWHQF
jgi:hypothetical protein